MADLHGINPPLPAECDELRNQAQFLEDAVPGAKKTVDDKILSKNPTAQLCQAGSDWLKVFQKSGFLPTPGGS